MESDNSPGRRTYLEDCRLSPWLLGGEAYLPNKKPGTRCGIPSLDLLVQGVSETPNHYRVLPIRTGWQDSTAKDITYLAVSYRQIKLVLTKEPPNRKRNAGFLGEQSQRQVYPARNSIQ